MSKRVIVGLRNRERLETDDRRLEAWVEFHGGEELYAGVGSGNNGE